MSLAVFPARTTLLDDVLHLSSSVAQTGEQAIRYLGKRTVILLRDLSKIAKSPDALKYAFEGALEIISTMQLYIAVTVSDRAMEWAQGIQMAVSAWSVGKSIQYIVTGGFLADCRVTKICTAVTEIFFAAARTLMVTAWLLEEGLISLSFCASVMGSIPVFGSALFVIGTSPLIDLFFLIGIITLFVDRARALVGGGYVNKEDEENQASIIKNELQVIPRNAQGIRVEGPLSRVQHETLNKDIARYIEAKKTIQLWVACADVVNLLAEAILLLFNFPPLAYNILGVIASSSGIISCVWDSNPKKPKVRLL